MSIRWSLSQFYLQHLNSPDRMHPLLTDSPIDIRRWSVYVCVCHLSLHPQSSILYTLFCFLLPYPPMIAQLALTDEHLGMFSSFPIKKLPPWITLSIPVCAHFGVYLQQKLPEAALRVQGPVRFTFNRLSKLPSKGNLPIHTLTNKITKYFNNTATFSPELEVFIFQFKKRNPLHEMLSGFS